MNETLDPREYVRRRLAAVVPQYRWDDAAGRIPEWQTEFRQYLAMLLGDMDHWRGDAPELDLQTIERAAGDGYSRETLTFATRPGLRAYAHLLVPENPNGVGIVALPGHGVGADGIAGLEKDDYQFDFGLQCVRRGFVTLVLEQFSFGHRRDDQAKGVSRGASSCVRDSMAALMLGESMTGWRVWDAMRGLDLLAARPDVDPAKLATIGISGGGLTSLFTGALDSRVAVCIVSGYFNTFADSILAMDHCVDNYAPGLLNLCEMPDLAGLVAPRRLFCESGNRDPIFPLPAFERAVAHAQRIYADCGCPENFGFEVFDGDHRFHGAGAFSFLDSRR